MATEEPRPTCPTASAGGTRARASQIKRFIAEPRADGLSKRGRGGNSISGPGEGMRGSGPQVATAVRVRPGGCYLKYPYTSSTRWTVAEEPAGMSHCTVTWPSEPSGTIALPARVRPGAKLTLLAM